MLVGILSGLLRFVMEICMSGLITLRRLLVSDVGDILPKTFNKFESFPILLITFLILRLLVVLSTSFLCKHVSPEAAGSGIPEMKYVLGGDIANSPDKYLSLSVLIVKYFGNILAVGAGLSIGSEGPLVHISSCVTNLIMNYTEYFDEIFYSATLKREVLTAAVAIGVSTTFNAPVGGVLFAVEVTATYFLLSNYWKVFIAAIVSAITFTILNYIRFERLFANSPSFAFFILSSIF